VRILGNILYLSEKDLTDAGISTNTVRSAKQRNSVGWTFIQHPEDGRKYLVQWPIKEPYATQVVEHFGDPHVYCRASYLESVLPPREQDLKDLQGITDDKGVGLGEAKVKKLHEVSRWLKLCSDVKQGQNGVLESLGMTKPEFWNFIPQYLETRSKEQGRIPVKLPKRYQKLLEKLSKYEKHGAASLVHGNLGNNNGGKLCEAGRHFVLSFYSLIIKPTTEETAFRYNMECKKRGWKQVTEGCIYSYLNKPEIKRIWYLARHGYKRWKNKYEHHLKLFLPSVRDALWIMDGTKLNLFYQDENGMAAKLQINKCIDAFSECILGYDIMFSENHVSAYVTIKNSVKNTGARPYQILYDGQGGYRKKEIQGLMSKLSSVHYPAQPYNPKSKHIESVIGRFQTQVMRKAWFFTGMNIESVTANSKPNYDFIKEHQKDLPTREELINIYIPQMIAEWNAAKHPLSGVPREQMYNQSQNPDHRAVDYLDMVDLFWLEREETYRKFGLKVEVARRKYELEVYDEATGMADTEFLRKYTGQKFWMKYDPEDMSHVRLYLLDHEGDFRYVASAHTKKAFARAAIDLTTGMRKEIDRYMQLRKEQRNDAESALQEANDHSGVSSEQLIRNGFEMGDKDSMNEAEENYHMELVEAAPKDSLAEQRRIERERFEKRKQRKA
jgi:hypothetical protein